MSGLFLREDYPRDGVGGDHRQSDEEDEHGASHHTEILRLLHRRSENKQDEEDGDRHRASSDPCRRDRESGSG